MKNQTSPQQTIEKYRKLLGLSEGATFSELKARYAELHTRFTKQLDSEEPEKVKKGQNNLILLDQAYNLLAKEIRAQQTASFQEATEEATAGPTRLSIELCSMRVGFQILEGGEFFALETKRISTNIAGMRSVRTNNKVSTNWPSGKLTIFNDHFKLTCIFGSFDFTFNDIVAITKVWYLPGFLCMKRKSDEAMRINIFGFGLGKKLKELSPQFTTRVQLDY
jgi:hypothetical protein